MTDENKILDELLQDWAMNSDDGLAGGYNTPENIKALEKTLVSKGFEKNYAKEFSKKFANDVQKIKPKTNLESKDGLPFNLNTLINIKKFPENIAKMIIKAVSSKKIFDDETRKEFIEVVYDRMTLEEAINFWNGNLVGKYQAFIEELDEKIKPQSASAGRGEYMFVLAIRGCESGGGQSGDLVLSGNKVVDVKELSKTSGEFRTTEASFGVGGFQRIQFVKAMNQLLATLVDKDVEDALITMCDEADLPGTRGGTKGPHAMSIQLFKSKTWQKLNLGALRGLKFLCGYMHGLPRNELEKLATGEKVEFNFDGEETTVAIKQIDPDVKKQITDPNLPPTNINVTISGISDKKMQLVLPKIMKLDLFSKAPSETDDILDPIKIAEEMFKNIEHYSGGILFYTKGAGFYYEENLLKLKKPFAFSGYSQTGPSFAPVRGKQDI